MKTTTKVYTINAANVDELADKYERYTLAAQPAAIPKRATFQSTKTRQAVLLTGLDCLAGQADLFDGIDGAK